ncbi:MAG TPA: hypothetical protein ENM97_04945 [Moorella mulderi]|nr:hypothetical protein [Moorella mulderi]
MKAVDYRAVKILAAAIGVLLWFYCSYCRQERSRETLGLLLVLDPEAAPYLEGLVRWFYIYCFWRELPAQLALSSARPFPMLDSLRREYPWGGEVGAAVLDLEGARDFKTSWRILKSTLRRNYG